ncbi:hypothetical protein GVX82_00650 [Patescibacteria group bacterium]|jgi:hypothetical protein|nr:hypothetical protein [Patescibacteria group bacterium]
MSPDREERIEHLVRENIKLTKENNRLLRKLWRAQVWGTVTRLVWILILLGVPIVVYLYFLKPFVEGLVGEYESIFEAPASAAESIELNVEALPAWARAVLGGESGGGVESEAESR